MHSVLFQVLLGLGLPWTIGALYWAAMGGLSMAQNPQLTTMFATGGMAGDLSSDHKWFEKYSGESRILILFCVKRMP